MSLASIFVRGILLILVMGSQIYGDTSLPDQETISHVFGEALGKFTEERGFPGAVVCVYQQHEMILNKAYGRGVSEDQVYPLVSTSKIFTRAAIEQLIQGNSLSREDKVWKYLNLNGAPKDSRVLDITIGQLLAHQGGWNSDISGNPLFSLIQAPNQKAFIEKVISSTMLDFAPGAQRSYSDFGYLLLGMVIEEVTGMEYLTYINKILAEPLDCRIDQAKTPSIYSRNTPFSGTFSLELATSSIGLAVRAQDMAKIVDSMSQSREETWWLDGSLTGTVTSLVRKRFNNVTIVVFIPDRDDNCWKDDNDDLRRVIDHAASKAGL